MKGAKNIKAFFFDVDGTLTSGILIFGTKGEAYKTFHAQDGMALGLVHRIGYITGFITGRTSDIVRARAEELKVDVLLMGVKDKVKAVSAVLEKYHLSWDEVAFMGDDLNDLPLFDKVGVSGSPSNGVPENLRRAEFISRCSGGNGAAREFIEEILKEQGRWDEAVASFYTEMGEIRSQ